MDTAVLYQDYSGAFCALACSRSARSAAKIAIKQGDSFKRIAALFLESEFWMMEFVKRRASARMHRGYIAPLPENARVLELQLQGKRRRKD
jgi:hypothetical protein